MCEYRDDRIFFYRLAWKTVDWTTLFPFWTGTRIVSFATTFNFSPPPQSTVALPLHRTFTADHQKIQVQTHRDAYFCSAFRHHTSTSAPQVDNRLLQTYARSYRYLKRIHRSAVSAPYTFLIFLNHLFVG